MRFLKLLYIVSNNEDANNLDPNESNFVSLCHENINCGLHLTVIHNIIVSITAVVSCCATSAHTPQCAYAITIPNIAENNVPPIVEKKNLLKSIFLDTYACCIPFTPDTTIVKLITLIIGINDMSS